MLRRGAPGYDGSLSSMSPGFVPDSSALSQAMLIAFISPGPLSVLRALGNRFFLWLFLFCESPLNRNTEHKQFRQKQFRPGMLRDFLLNEILNAAGLTQPAVTEREDRGRNFMHFLMGICNQSRAEAFSVQKLPNNQARIFSG